MIQNFSECRPLPGERCERMEALPASIQVTRSSNPRSTDEQNEDEHNILHLHIPENWLWKNDGTCRVLYLKLRQESVASKPFYRQDTQSRTIRELRAGNFHIQ